LSAPDPDALFAEGHYLAAARGYQAQGRTAEAAEAYGAAGSWDRAGGVLAEARRFREAGMAFLRMLPAQPVPANLLSQEQSRCAKQAAKCFERCAEIPLAVALLTALGDYPQASTLLRKAGRRADAQQVAKGRPLAGSPWAPGFLSSAPAAAPAPARTGVATMPRPAHTRVEHAPDGWILPGPQPPLPTGQVRGPTMRGPALSTGYAARPATQSVRPGTQSMARPHAPPADATRTGAAAPNLAPEAGLPPLPAADRIGSPSPSGYLGDPEADPFVGFGERAADPFFGAGEADPDPAEAPGEPVSDSGNEAIFALGGTPRRPEAPDEPFTDVHAETAEVPAPAPGVQRRRSIEEAVSTRSIEMGLGPLERGSLIADRYEVRGALGEGGFAVVFRVFDRSLEEEVALKLFKPEGNDARGIERFKREIRMARQLAHPNIVRTWEYGTWRAAHYMTMELLEGLDLHSYNQEIHWSRMPLWLALELTAQALDGLGHAHEHDVVHRDIKLRNLFVTKGRGFLPDDGPKSRAPRLKVMDFGIAAGGGFEAGLTRTGMVVGTPTFVPPERLRPNAGEPQNTVDIYAMGVVLYRLLTGRLPLHSKNIGDLFKKNLAAAPSPPSRLDPELPDDVDAAVLRLMARRPDDRPQDAFEAADELRDLAREHRGGTR
jgi:tetratricopeptide (TPR) repeat protein